MEAALFSEIYLFCIILVSFILYWVMRTHMNSASVHWFRYVLTSYLCCFVFDLLFVIFNDWILAGTNDIRAPLFLKSMTYLFCSLGVYFWCIYTETVLGRDTFRSSTNIILIVMPVILPTILVITNFYTHKLFWFGQDRSYIRGPHYDLLMLYLIICTLLAEFRIIFTSPNRTDPVWQIQRKQLASFPISLTISWILSFIFKEQPVNCVCIAIELLYLYISSSNQMILIDKLTQVNNRQNLVGYLSDRLHNHAGSFFLFMLDLDHFKAINDNYGHLEGDAALIRVANALKQACSSCKKRPFISRYGGDEFIIIADLPQEEIPDFCSLIQNRLDEINSEAEAPYSLHLSIGYVQCEEGMLPEQLIKTADARLYLEKRNRNSKKQ